MGQDPGPDAEPWARLHSTSGPWYDEQIAQKLFFRPQHTGAESDPWRLRSIECGAQAERPPLGKELPPLQRSRCCPGQAAVPDLISRGYDQSTLEKRPKVYILAFPGMGDAVSAGWVKHEMETPENFEWGTYEWPGHGERRDETRRTCVAELGADAFETFREAMSVGHFILVGHSIGVLLMTYVAIRAERELGARPLACFVLDRTAPHQRVYSPYSDWLALNDRVSWLRTRYPSVARALEGGTPGAEDTADMITKDESVQTDTVPPELYGYSFPCKVYVFIALWMSSRAPRLEDLSEGVREELRRHYCNGKGYNFDPEEFDEWNKWGSDIDIRKVEVDHKGLVMHNRFLTVLYREVAQLLKKGEAALGKKGGKTPSRAKRA